MTKSVTVIPVLTQVLHLCCIVGSIVVAVKSKDMYFEKMCDNIYVFICVMSVYWFLCFVANGFLVRDLYMGSNDMTAVKKDTILLHFQIVFLFVALACTLIGYLNKNSECDGYLLNFVYVCCWYYGTFMIGCILMLVDKNYYCCVKSEKKVQMDRRVCCWCGVKRVPVQLNVVVDNGGDSVGSVGSNSPKYEPLNLQENV